MSKILYLNRIKKEKSFQKKGNKNMTEILQATLIPFIGTALGSACVFFMVGGLSETLKRLLSAFAAGIMTAASVWSLLIPAIEQAEERGSFYIAMPPMGLLTGILVFIAIDRFIDVIKKKNGNSGNKSSMLVLAVVIHNIPEGMAAGAVYAAILTGSTEVSATAALALVTGISIQNFPEGAIISLPLRAKGKTKINAFFQGIISGVAEALGALITLAAANLIVPVLPLLLSFAAGAMLYVVVRELVPEFPGEKYYDLCTAVFAGGFIVMMVLDTLLG